jgi:hypothetical protein
MEPHGLPLPPELPFSLLSFSSHALLLFIVIFSDANNGGVCSCILCRPRFPSLADRLLYRRQSVQYYILCDVVDVPSAYAFSHVHWATIVLKRSASWTPLTTYSSLIHLAHLHSCRSSEIVRVKSTESRSVNRFPNPSTYCHCLVCLVCLTTPSTPLQF